jgi:hypothetical protein
MTRRHDPRAPGRRGRCRSALAVALGLAAVLGCSPPDDAPRDRDDARAGRDALAPDLPATTDTLPTGDAGLADPPRRPGIRFHPDTLLAGPGGTARVGELALDSVWLRDPARGRDAHAAFFRGEISLSGATMIHPDADAGLVAVCFEPDPMSAARMPRWDGDERRIWFCFDNAAAAARALAPPGQVVDARIVIDRYTIHYGASDEVNTARLARVVAREGSSP